MFKNKKLSKVQVLSLVASLTIFVGGSFNNEVMGESITEIKFEKISCSSKYEIDLNSTTKNKTKHTKEVEVPLPKEILKLYLEKTKDQPYDDSIKDLAKNITVYNQLIGKVEKLINDYNKINKKNKSSKKTNELISKKEAELAKEIAKTKLSIAITYDFIYNSTKTIVQKVEKNKIHKIKSKKSIILFRKQKQKYYIIKNAINKVESAKQTDLDIGNIIAQYNSEFIKFTNQSEITNQSKDDTSLLDSVKNDSDNNDNLSSVSSIIVLSPVVNTINERLYLFNNINIGNNSNLISSSGDNSDIKLSNNNNNNYSFELWSKVHYNYGKVIGNKDLSIHVPGFSLGFEYNINNSHNYNYKLGLVYTFGYGININNYNDNHYYLSNSFSAYFGMNNISIKNFKNNFVNVILTYGRLNNNNSNKNYNYNINVVSLDTIFGHNIILDNNNNILTPVLGLRYNYINRDYYKDNNNISFDKVSLNILTPILGISYTKNNLLNNHSNNNLSLKIGTSFEYDINLNNSIDTKIGLNNKYKTISYITKNAFKFNLNFDLNYKIKNNIELSFDTNTSINTKGLFNLGFGIGGKYKF